MEMQQLKSIWVKLLLIGLIIIIIDQATKIMVMNYLLKEEYQSYQVNSFFNLSLAFNYGISFSMLSTLHSDYKVFFIILPLVIVLMILIWFHGLGKINKQRRKLLPTGLIIGGALGNIIDRIRIGAVIDFIDLHVLEYHYPVFNIADSSIVIGTILIFMRYIVRNSKYVNKCFNKS